MNRLELSADRVDALVNLPQVADARKQLAESPVVYFSAELSPELRDDLAAMGVTIPSVPSVPLRWIRGDTPAHVDVGADAFERTHLVYLTDSEGEFLLDGVSYPITKGSGFTFDHGISHGTRGTGSTPRLLLGPMSEQADPVGASPPCFPEGTRIQTADGYKAVETLTTSDRVATADGRFVEPKIFRFSLHSATQETAPYRIEAGSLGPHYPPRALCLSPLHALLDPAGVWHIPKTAAKHNPGIQQYGVGKPITYYHIECPDFYRDNLLAEGAVVESFKNRQGARTVVYEWVSSLNGFRRIPKEDSYAVPNKSKTLVVY
jgi:hypothetical protein